MGSGMGDGMGHNSMGSSTSSSHGNPNTTRATSQKPTVNDILTKNPAVGSKITALTGATSAAGACTGFKILVNLSLRRTLPEISSGNFYCLREAMTGTAAHRHNGPAATGTMSLGQAIQSYSGRQTLQHNRQVRI